MVTVKFRFYGQLKDVVKAPTAEIAVPEGSTLRQALSDLGQTYGDAFNRRIFKSCGGLQASTRLYLNDEPLEEEALDHKLERPEAEVSVFVVTAVQGG